MKIRSHSVLWIFGSTWAMLLSACTVQMSEPLGQESERPASSSKQVTPRVIRGERPSVEKLHVVDRDGNLESFEENAPEPEPTPAPAALAESVKNAYVPKPEPAPKVKPTRKTSRPDPQNMREAVRRYILNHARNPGSVKLVKWYPVKATDEGYVIRCRYRTDGGTFGLIEEDKFFYLNRSGKIYRTGASAQAGTF